jgi:uncharacterized protein
MMFRVHDTPAASRFDAYQDGEVAGSVYYRMQGAELWLVYTEIRRCFQNQGLAEILIAGTLADAHRRRLAVLPFCPAVREFLARHPSYNSMVPSNQRGRFRASVLPAVTEARVQAAADAKLVPPRPNRTLEALCRSGPSERGKKAARPPATTTSKAGTERDRNMDSRLTPGTGGI